MKWVVVSASKECGVVRSSTGCCNVELAREEVSPYYTRIVKMILKVYPNLDAAC